LYPLLRVGPFTVSSYTALVDFGLLAGGLVTCLAARRRRLGLVQVLDAALAAVLGGLVGGRIAYVAAHWAYYVDHLPEAIRVWGGGLSWHGAFAGGLAAVLAYSAVRRDSPRVLLDVLACGAAVLAICVWLACLLSGCAYGIETYPGQGLPWAFSMEPPDFRGIWMPRVAVQLVGAGWGVLVLVVVAIATRRPCSMGLVFPLWLTLHCVGSFGLGFLRADEVALVRGWRADQLIDLVLGTAGAMALGIGLLRGWRCGEVAVDRD
jgi:phosphatidylglycerol:prolipoprotein diacylglycerol transferase